MQSLQAFIMENFPVNETSSSNLPPNSCNYRFQACGALTEALGSLSTTFFPPTSTEDRPKITTDVGDAFMRRLLSQYLRGPGATGSLSASYLATKTNFVVEVNNTVYTDDLPFWLGLIKSGKTYEVIYGIITPATSLTVW